MPLLLLLLLGARVALCVPVPEEVAVALWLALAGHTMA